MRPEHHALSFSLRRTEDKSTSRSTRGTNWFRKRDAVSCLRPRCPACSPSIFPAPSFSFSHTGPESIKPLAQARTRSSYSSGSLSRRKIYVNRHVDTCSNVTGARTRAERSEEGRLGSRVTGMQCRISPCSLERERGGRKGERNAHFEMQRRRERIRMCV